MKNEQRPQPETPSSDASRGEQFAHPIVGDGVLDNHSRNESGSTIRERIKRAASLYFDRDGRVVEMRILGVSGGSKGTYTAAGYFDNIDAFVDAAIKYDGRCSGVYATLNLIDPALLGRANNRIVDYPKSSTGEQDVKRLVRLMVDIDPHRTSNVSSTDAELESARAVAREVVSFLEALGFPQPARALSGNGIHAIYAVDLPVQDTALIKSCLRALSFRFDDDAVRVDMGVYKAAQLGKVYGTMACKGDPLPDRPHRRTQLQMPADGLVVVPREALERLAAMEPRTDAKLAEAASDPKGALNVDDFLQRAGISVSKSGPWSGGHRWSLAVCPFNDSHKRGEAYVVQLSSGALSAGCHHNSCQWGWRELRQKFDPGWTPVPSRSSGGFGGLSLGRIPDIWCPPQPIPNELLPVPPLRPELLPEELRDWLVDISERIQCPLDFPAIGAVVALSSVLGRKVGIKPMRFDDWLVAPNLWGAIVGRPGAMKSPALKPVMSPLYRLERDALAEHRLALERHEAAEIAWKKRKDRLGGKDVDDLDDDALAERAAQLVDQKPKAPPRPRRVVNDPSHEKLGEILSENPNGVLVFRDELVGLLRKLDKDGNEEARTFYLEAWDGDKSYTFDRIVRGTVHVPCLILSVLGGIQPGPLIGYMLAGSRSGSGDDGLVQRFQVWVWPDRSGEWIAVDRFPDSDARRRAHAVYEKLAKLTAIKAGAEIDAANLEAIPWLRFDQDAQDRFLDWRRTLESRLRSHTDSEALESHFSKYRSLIPSLALLFHLIDVGGGPVGLASLERAIEFSEYLASHARRIYGAAADTANRTARLIAKKISAGELASPFVLKDIYSHGWSGLTDADTVRQGVQRLVDLDWLQVVEQRRDTGRPSHTYFINPDVPKTPSGGASKTSESPPAEGLGGFGGDPEAQDTDIDDEWEVMP